MTRKKFIKYAMSKGYSRNKATLIAKSTIKMLKSYENCYKHLNVAVWLMS